MRYLDVSWKTFASNKSVASSCRQQGRESFSFCFLFFPFTRSEARKGKDTLATGWSDGKSIHQLFVRESSIYRPKDYKFG